jgi:hypothetical protein
MPKRARVAIVVAAMIIFAIAMLDLVRSKVEASGRALKTVAVQYSTLKRIYAAPAEVDRAAANGQAKRQYSLIPETFERKQLTDGR